MQQNEIDRTTVQNIDPITLEEANQTIDLIEKAAEDLDADGHEVIVELSYDPTNDTAFITANRQLLKHGIYNFTQGDEAQVHEDYEVIN